jgi:hypothetical protein
MTKVGNGSHLHVECNHLSTMSPGVYWIIVRRINPCALRIHSEYILLGEPEYNLNASKTVYSKLATNLKRCNLFNWLVFIVCVGYLL